MAFAVGQHKSAGRRVARTPRPSDRACLEAARLAHNFLLVRGSGATRSKSQVMIYRSLVCASQCQDAKSGTPAKVELSFLFSTLYLSFARSFCRWFAHSYPMLDPHPVSQELDHSWVFCCCCCSKLLSFSVAPEYLILSCSTFLSWLNSFG